MARRPRLQEAGATYHVTTHGIAELAVLPDGAARSHFLTLLGETAARCAWRVRSYCVLTTHYHALVTTTRANVAEGMQQLNGRYARWLNRELGRRGHVWEARYHGYPIETDSHLLETIRYIALNPVRAGIANAPSRWTWSSYPALVGLEPAMPFLEHRAVLALFGSTRRAAVERLRSFVEIAASPGDGLRFRD